MPKISFETCRSWIQFVILLRGKLATLEFAFWKIKWQQLCHVEFTHCLLIKVKQHVASMDSTTCAAGIGYNIKAAKRWIDCFESRPPYRWLNNILGVSQVQRLWEGYKQYQWGQRNGFQHNNSGSSLQGSEPATLIFLTISANQRNLTQLIFMEKIYHALLSQQITWTNYPTVINLINFMPLCFIVPLGGSSIFTFSSFGKISILIALSWEVSESIDLQGVLIYLIYLTHRHLSRIFTLEY